MADDRTYIRVHDGMPDHPKIDGLSDRAFRLLIETWCWSSRHRTDGRVPRAVWVKRGSRAARGELVTAGLAVPGDDAVQMHDYLEHQRSAAQIAEQVEAKRRAGAVGNHRRWHRGGRRDPSCDLCVADARPHTRSHVRSQEASQNGRETSPDTDTEKEQEASPPAATSAATGGRAADIKIAQDLARRYYDRVPMSNFPAIMAIVKRARGTGRYPDDAIAAALERMATAGQAVTVNALRYELEGFPARTAPNRNDREIAELLARTAGPPTLPAGGSPP